MDDEKPRKAPQRSVTLLQIGDIYRVDSTTNFLDVRVGAQVEKAEAQTLIENGINVRVIRNK